MGAGDRRSYGISGFIVAALLGASLIVPTSAASAVEVDGAPAVIDAGSGFLDPGTITGATPDTAAASCWEIKQLHPDSGSGAYWVLTEAMTAPTQVWCDQETDGGGWVKVGQGRQGWETNAVGRGSASTLLDPNPAPDSVTTQLSASTVDEILNGKKVTDLADGVRVRRAASIDGSSWQEVRFSLTKSVGWFWSMGAGWPLSSWRVGTASGSGGSSTGFGSGSSDRVVDTSIGSNHSYTWGFSYGNGVSGSSAGSSYLWTPSDGQGGARPFSQVYLRPQLSTSQMAYPRVSNSGTSAIQREITPDSNALTNPWGVTGLAGSVSREGDVEVQDMTAIGNTMYVAGNFRYVQRDANGGGRTEQPFLAAFNATSGEFISSFRPSLNEAVLAVSATPGGKLAIGGKFTRVNGTASTGFAVIDPSTGQLSGPQTSLTNSSSPGNVRVETITANGSDLYVGGSFTHSTGPNTATRYTRNAARINATNMEPLIDWRPELNGTVLDIDVADDGSMAYFAGFLTRMGTQDAISVAAVSTASPATLDTAWQPTWSSTGKFYQRAIEREGDRIYVGGSEHSMFAYDAQSYVRLTSHISNPKGDFQTLLAVDGFLYGGSHSNSYIYDGATNWPNVGSAWTRADTIGWTNAFRLDAGSSSVSTFSPTVSARLGSGAWATAAAPDGTIWSGGDFQRARVQGGGSAWTGAFVRYPMTDGAAPSAPTNLRTTDVTADSVRLAWNGSSTGIGAGGSYQIIRDNRVIATTTVTNITVPLGGEYRYFVRAADATGNVSASTPVLQVPGGNPPPTPSFTHTVNGLDVTFDASATTDDGAISAYHWDFGDGATSTDSVVTHRFFGGGTYDVTLTVVDDRGAWATTSYRLELAQPRPSDAYGATVWDDSPLSFWRLDEPVGQPIAADSATGTRLANYTNGVTQGVAGVVPGSMAAEFDGSDDLVVSQDAVSGPNEFSLEIWFKTTTNRGGKLIGFGNASTGTSTSYDRHIYMQDDGRLVFGVYSGGMFTVTTSDAYNDGDWHYAVGTLSAAGMTFSVDGESVGTNPQTVGQDYTGYWRVGGDTTWGSSSAYFDGTLDEVAIYDVALTPQQIWSHYSTALQLPNQAPSAEFTHASEGLVLSVDASASTDLDGQIESATWDFGDGSAPASGITASHTYAGTGVYTVTLTVTDDEGAEASVQHPVSIVTRPPDAYGAAVFEDMPWAQWRLEESSGTVAIDSSRGGHAGEYAGGVALGAAGIHPNTFGAAFDGNDDFVVASDQIPGPQTFSTELWFSTTTTRGGKLIGFSSRNSGTSDHYDRHVYMQDDGRLVFGIYDGAERTLTSTASYNDGEWHHVVTSLSASGMNLYIDGQLVGSNSYAVAEDFAGYWRVGGDRTWGSTSDYFEGLIDEAAIYDTALTAQQVTDHYAIGIQIPNQPPVVQYSFEAQYLDVSFDASASTDDGQIAQLTWDFGDGTPAETGAVVTHSYAQAGTYTVVATATDDEGLTALLSRVVTVTAPPNQAPVAGFTHDADYLDVAFTSTSTDVDGSISSWAWDFGDGTPGAAGADATHSYAAAGSYDVSLTVTDDDGDSATVTQTVEVFEAPNQEPVAAFEFSSQFLVVQFDGSGSADTDGQITSVTWDFGDGSATVTGDAGALTQQHTFDVAGTYTVTLTVTDDEGASGVTSRDVTVATQPANVPPAAAFDYTATFLEVSFDGSTSADSDGTVAEWAWDFGDGSPVDSSSGATVQHTYAAAGTYTVTLTVTDDDSDTGQVVRTFDVAAEPLNQPPLAQAEAVVTDLSVAVDGSASTDPDGDAIATWAWDFGDGTDPVTMTTATATHSYAAAGDYTITLTVTDDKGATGSVTVPVTATEPINTPPAAAFTWAATQLSVAFDASTSSDDDGSIASWAWAFGDGSATATGESVTHDYAQAGTYEVVLTITDDRGAQAQATQQVTVTEVPDVPSTREVITRESTWDYWYKLDAPASTWAQPGFTPSGWLSGAAPIGYGAPQIVTNLNPAPSTADRPRAAYFRTTFDVEDASKAISLDLTAIGDDGAVVYVNGVEVGRVNMRDGAVTHFTYAPSARRMSAAETNLLSVQVPADVLVTGTNVVAAETHVNYRGTPDMSFWAAVSLTELTGPPAPNQAPVASFTYTAIGLDATLTSTSTDTDGSIATTVWDFGDSSAVDSGAIVSHTFPGTGTYDVTMTVTDDDGAVSTITQQVSVEQPTGQPVTSNVVSQGTVWSYWYDQTAPESDWQQVAFNTAGWQQGSGPIGYGSNRVVTDLDPSSTTADRPRAVYFRSSFDVDDIAQVVSLDLTVIGDDGVVLYVNGVEVGRKNMRDGAVTPFTYAQSGRRVSVAEGDLLRVEVPRDLLVNGTNVIAAETHVNFRATSDVTFWAEAQLTELR